MKFSTRATYGLKAMLYLAERYGESAVSVSQIAEAEKISAAYLEQILSRIKHEGWVKSVRGPRGGYVLAVPPSELKIGALLSALEEDIRIKRSSEPAMRRARPLPHTAAELFWRRLSEAFVEALDRVSLEELIQSARREAREPAGAGTAIHFNI